MAGFVSPRLGIRFDPGEGPDNLRIFGPDGTRFLTFTEWVEKAKADERRAEAERQRADDADRRADEQTRLASAERQRADQERQLATEQTQLATEQTRLAAAERQRATKKAGTPCRGPTRRRLAARLRELGIEPE